MKEKIKTFWKSLDRIIVVNQRELVLGVAACTLAGMVVGLLASPRKCVTIGSNNSNNGSNNSAASHSGEETQEEA